MHAEPVVEDSVCWWLLLASRPTCPYMQCLVRISCDLMIHSHSLHPLTPQCTQCTLWPHNAPFDPTMHPLTPQCTHCTPCPPPIMPYAQGDFASIMYQAGEEQIKKLAGESDKIDMVCDLAMEWYEIGTRLCVFVHGVVRWTLNWLCSPDALH